MKPAIDLEGRSKLAAAGWAVFPASADKTYVFTNFTEAFAFMTKVAVVAEEMDHHPNWTNIYNTVKVSLTTHDIQGLSDLDVDLANKMDNIANS